MVHLTMYMCSLHLSKMPHCRKSYISRGSNFRNSEDRFYLDKDTLYNGIVICND